MIFRVLGKGFVMTILQWRILSATWLAVLVVGSSVIGAPVPAQPSDSQLNETALKLNDLATTEAMQNQLTAILKDRAATKRLVTVAAKLQADAKEKEAPFKFNGAFVLAKLAHNVKDYTSAELFYKFCKANALKIESGKKLSEAYDGLIDLYWEQKKFLEVEELCAELLNSENESDDIQGARGGAIEKMIQAKARRGDHDEALNMVDAIIASDKNGGNWYALKLKSDVLREAGKLDKAIEIYPEIMKKIKADKGLKKEPKEILTRNLRYALTGLYVENKDIDQAAKILEVLVKEVPENAVYKNDLGFIWADNDQNLEESEKLIREALALDAKAREKALKDEKIDAELAKKVNAGYQDSLGWVLYKNKKYEEAIKLLTEASADEDDGQHMEIWDHLADAHFANKDTKKAVEIWTKALKFDDVSKRDIERRKTIGEKIAKVKAAEKENLKK